MSAAALDALPYYDRDIEADPSLRQRVEREIAAELARSPPPKGDPTNVAPLPDLFASSPLLATALQRVEAGSQPLAAPTEGLDTSRYGLPGPETDDEASWRAAFDNASAQLEHQRLRLGTLDLMGRFGANAWRIDNFLLERNIERTKRELEDVKARTEDVNRRRKASQTEAGATLTELESRWTRLVSQNLQLEIANIALENELSELSKREGHLKARIEGLSAQAAEAAA